MAYVELFVDENDKPRGCGIIEFETVESAQLAVEKMHRYELKGRKLVVKEVSPIVQKFIALIFTRFSLEKFSERSYVGINIQKKAAKIFHFMMSRI